MLNLEQIKMLKRLGIIAFFFLIGVLIISAVNEKKASSATEILIDIEQLEVGRSMINREDVLRILDNAFGYSLTAVPIGGLDVERVERVLRSDAFVKEARVYIDANNKIHIELTQREPILRIVDKNGLTYYLDREGGKVPVSKHYSPRVLVATGNIPPFDRDYLDKKQHIVKDLYLLTQRILKDEFLEPMIEQLYVSKNEGYQLIPNIGDQKIIFGKMDRLEEKILFLKNFYKEALPYKGWQKYKTINLTFKGQVVAKKK